MRVGDAINLYYTAPALQMNLRTIGRGSANAERLRNACGRSEIELWICGGLGQTCTALPAYASKNRGAGFSLSLKRTYCHGVNEREKPVAYVRNRVLLL
jgi:hypothetical protein